MNIAMVQPTPWPPEEGIGNYTYNLGSELLGRGHSISVITRGRLQRKETYDDGFRVIRLPCPPVYPFHVDVHGILVNRFLKQWEGRFDLVHAHTPLTPVIQTSLPLVSTIHTSIVEDNKHTHGWNLTNVMSTLMVSISSRRLIAGQSNAADRITTTSGPVRRELAEHYGIDDATVIGNGVNADRFYLDGDSDERYVLFVGRLDYPKGLPDLLEAAKPVVEKHDIEFKIAGKGPFRERLEQQAKRQGIADKVSFIGHVYQEQQLRRLYQNATAFVLPSHYEGLPTVLLEAMACGAPVVATTVGGCPEVIEDGTNGLLVPPKEPPALTEAIDTLLTDADMRDRFGTNARQTILDRYTWETITDVFEREYRLARETS